MTPAAVPWSDVAAQLRPFVARRVDASEVDDVLQDVLIRTQRGLAGLRDEERLSAWLLQVARSAIADHGRARARHPIADPDATPEPIAEPTDADADRAAFQALAGLRRRASSPGCRRPTARRSRWSSWRA